MASGGLGTDRCDQAGIIISEVIFISGKKGGNNENSDRCRYAE